MKTVIKIFLCLIVAIMIAIPSFMIVEGYSLYKDSISDKSISERIDDVRNKSNYIEISDVSNDFLTAIVSVEDHRFYGHHGVDYISLARAVFQNIKERRFSAGGSTITQQLAKNLLFSREKKIKRKIAEFFAVSYIENNYTKDEILELYINSIYYGDGFTGINDAAGGYYNVSPKNLTIDQAVILAGLPQSPSRYALSSNYEKAVKRANQVIKAMVRRNKISEDEAEKIKSNLKSEDQKLMVIAA